MRIRFWQLIAAGAAAAMIGAPAAFAQTDAGPPAPSPDPSELGVPQPADGTMNVSQEDHERFKLIQPGQSCGAEGPMSTDVMCQSPGNVQINDSLPMMGGFGFGMGMGMGGMGGMGMMGGV